MGVTESADGSISELHIVQQAHSRRCSKGESAEGSERLDQDSSLGYNGVHATYGLSDASEDAMESGEEKQMRAAVLRTWTGKRFEEFRVKFGPNMMDMDGMSWNLSRSPFGYEVTPAWLYQLSWGLSFQSLPHLTRISNFSSTYTYSSSASDINLISRMELVWHSTSPPGY
ncbi:uncharacterized protein RSE6_13509 [Rhynchosporium secalis]|uniref:Uncharacterized protein n=1 Tax=Rhynchosporium secalis TaxID=38038 RepID=A0A1E1MT16_RHYSE|nr:uncharacterized protein RSE6_13509 [Rhynchosporium secalis]